MNENSPESTKPLADMTNVLTALSSNDGSLSLTINVDKSIRKFAEWWLNVIMVNSIVLGAVIVVMIFMIIFWWNSANEKRLLQQQMVSMQALLLREGIVKPGDLDRGPEGNIEYQRKGK